MHPETRHQEQMDASISELAEQEKEANGTIAAAAGQKEERIAKARNKAQQLLEQGRSQAQEQKAQVLEKAEQEALKECRVVIAKAEKEADALRAAAAKRQAKAAAELKTYFYLLLSKEA